jgi:hypothetical protein
MSERGLTNQWEPWQRLIDSIGPSYRTQLFAARDRARGELSDLDEEQLEVIAAEGRTVAGSLDEEGAASDRQLDGGPRAALAARHRPGTRGRTAPSAPARGAGVAAPAKRAG